MKYYFHILFTYFWIIEMNEDMELTSQERRTSYFTFITRLYISPIVWRKNVDTVRYRLLLRKRTWMPPLALCSRLFFDSSFKLPNKLPNNFLQTNSRGDELFVKLSQDSSSSSSGIRVIFGNQESITVVDSFIRIMSWFFFYQYFSY